METPAVKPDPLTLSQRQAVAARGNVLVMAGAGTGKTKTLVERCLDCLERDGAQIDELLIVTFTEAAAAEMRERLRRAIEAKAAVEAGNYHSNVAVKPGEDESAVHFWAEQLARFDLAHIGTLHSFCLKLVREHFYEIGLDPRLTLLDEGEVRQLADETLDEQFSAHYAGEDDFSFAVQDLIQVHGGGRDENIRKLVLQLHHYSQARPNAAGWLEQQRNTFSAAEPTDWQHWLLAAITDWRDEWLPALEKLGASAANEKAVELTTILRRLPKNIIRETAAEVLKQIGAADGNWPAKRKTALRKPFEDLFNEVEFLLSLTKIKNGTDPLAEDWAWVRGQMETLVRLAEEFAQKLADRKRTDSVLDFHDLEQFALKLLWDFVTGQPTAITESWREKLRFVFVDEYQDINAAQDKIIQGLSRDKTEDGADGIEMNETSFPSPRQNGERVGMRGIEQQTQNLLTPALSSDSGGEGEKNTGNRFLVGDVKQSIYRFRLADPKIFRDYSQCWHGETGQTIPLSENFRSREGLLNFVNSVFRQVMCEEVGGVAYDMEAKLKFGSSATRSGLSVSKNSAPCAELLVRFKADRNENREDENDELAGLDETQREARLVAQRLRQFAVDKHEIFDDQKKILRPVEWHDMAILLRSPRGRSEIFVREFELAGVPLAVARGGFYRSTEILDLLSLLQLLDNPLQDVPCIAVLRSPLVGLSLDELVEIRLAAKDKHFWTALARSRKPEARGQKSEIRSQKETAGKVSKFLERFSRWRTLARQVSLSQCLEEILAETLYAEWLQAQPRGAQRAANVASLLHLAQQFDQFQRQGLFRFLKFIETQQEAEVEPEVPAVPTENAVRLMSIHQSKGLEFPVVVLADLAKPFNEQDLRGEIIFDEEFGLCPKVKPPQTGRRYPSLPHWLARRRQKRELRGEELRLLYVAMTRARDHLILTASVTEKNWEEKWSQPQPLAAQNIAKAKCFADWMSIWFSNQSSSQNAENKNQFEGELPELRWRIVPDAELTGQATGSRGGEASVDDQRPIANGGFQIEPPRVGCYEEIEKLRTRLEWNYPFAAATRRKAKSSVTALRHEAEELDDEADQLFVARRTHVRKPKAENRELKLSAAEIGVAHHRFLQHVALGKADDLAAEAERLMRENYLSADERAVLDLKALTAFWNSDLGQKIRSRANEVHRELPFTARFSPAEIAEITGNRVETGLENEFVVVQGVADLAVLLPEEIWVVDFKTDEFRTGELPEKIRTYRPQLRLYAAALEKIYGRKATLLALHFLAERRTEMV